jgi:DNA-binding transcriptional MerR regulator
MDGLEEDLDTCINLLQKEADLDQGIGQFIEVYDTREGLCRKVQMILEEYGGRDKFDPAITKIVEVMEEKICELDKKIHELDTRSNVIRDQILKEKGDHDEVGEAPAAAKND